MVLGRQEQVREVLFFSFDFLVGGRVLQDLWTCSKVGEARWSFVFFVFVFYWGADGNSLLLGTLEQVWESLSFFI